MILMILMIIIIMLWVIASLTESHVSNIPGIVYFCQHTLLMLSGDVPNF